MFAVMYKKKSDTQSGCYKSHIEKYTDAIEIEENFYHDCGEANSHELYITYIIEHE